MEIMKRVLMEKTQSAEPSALKRYLKLNFKRNVPDEKKWRKGGFVSLKLTDGFYESATAARIFLKLYGIRQSKVVLNDCGPLLDRVENKFSSKSDRVDVSDESDVEVFKEVRIFSFAFDKQ